MTNPTSGWDQVPIFGKWLNIDNTPKLGKIQFTLTDRVNLVDGTAIYPRGGKLVAPLVTTGPTAGSISTSFPASDDPNIMQTGWSILVEEQLNDGSGQNYYIIPRLVDLSNTPPGVNLNLVVVSADAPDTPDPVYMRGKPGGLAGLNSSGQVIDSSGTPVTGGGGGGATDLNSLTDVNTAGATSGQALVVTSVGPVTWGPGTVLATVPAGTIVDSMVSSSAAINVDKTADGTANKVYSAADKTKLAGISAGAAALGTTSTTALAGNTPYTPTSRTINGLDLTVNRSLTAANVNAVALTAVGAASGVAPLDSAILIPPAYFPSSMPQYVYEVSGSYPARPSGAAVVFWVGADNPTTSMLTNDIWMAVT